MPVTAEAGPGRNQELKTPSGSPVWVVGTQVLKPLPAASQEAGSRSRRAKTQTKSSDIINASVPYSDRNTAPNTCPKASPFKGRAGGKKERKPEKEWSQKYKWPKKKASKAK